MFAAAKPEPHPRMLDRFLVIAEANELAARIVINKMELVGERRRARARSRDYERAGYPRALHEREARATGSRRCTTRSPGDVGAHRPVGRRQVVAAERACSPGSNLRVGEISESVNKGRHTTVGALLHPLPATTAATWSTRPGCARSECGGSPPTQLDAASPSSARFLDAVPLRRLHARRRARVRGARRGRGGRGERGAVRELPQAAGGSSRRSRMPYVRDAVRTASGGRSSRSRSPFRTAHSRVPHYQLPRSPATSITLRDPLRRMAPVRLHGDLRFVRVARLDRLDDRVVLGDRRADVARQHADVHADVALGLRLHAVVQREQPRAGARLDDLAVQPLVGLVQAAVIDAAPRGPSDGSRC